MLTHEHMDSTISAPVLADIARFTMTHLGIHFPHERMRDLARGLRAASEHMGFNDPSIFAEWLLKNPATPAQVEILAHHLTVGETYFFREPATFNALFHEALPDLIRERRASGARHLRLWSAGCATGEEPYTLAMSLETALPDISRWDVTLCATDINARFLQTARSGVYGPWSFRGVPQATRAAFFKRRTGTALEIAPRIRERVQFAQLNLAGDSYPSSINQTNAMDVIFCRNVLMYFGQSVAHDVVERMRHALNPGGWLVVAAAEYSQTLFKDFESVNFGEVVFYRKRSARTEQFIPAALCQAQRRRRVPEAPKRKVRALPHAAAALLPQREPQAAQAPAADGKTLAHLARVNADRGALAEALGWVQQAIATDKTDPSIHYMHASILLEMGKQRAAAAALDRALFLNPDFALAHYVRATISHAEGKSDRARRHLDSALSYLEQRPHDESITQAEGLTVQRLAEMVRAARETLS